MASAPQVRHKRTLGDIATLIANDRIVKTTIGTRHRTPEEVCPITWSPKWSPIFAVHDGLASAFLSLQDTQAAPDKPLHTIEQQAAPIGILLRIKICGV